MRSFLSSFAGARRDRRGQGIVEYALILVLVVTVLVTALSTIGHHNPGGNPMQDVANVMGDST
jgi:Flp pilus assembly pilin Flp